MLIDICGYVYAAGSSENGQLGTLHYNFTPKICHTPYVIMAEFSMQCPAIKVCAGDGFSIVLN